MNVKPEIWWSILQNNFSPGFEDILEHGITYALYDPNDPLEKFFFLSFQHSHHMFTNMFHISLIFQFLAILWLQAELDAFVSCFNSTLHHANRNKLLPHGIPNMINSKPHMFGTKDFRVGFFGCACLQTKTIVRLLFSMLFLMKWSSSGVLLTLRFLS